MRPNRCRTFFFPACFFFFIVFGTTVSDAKAQQKVANFSFGRAGTRIYERLSFWIDGEKMGDIIYAYGSERKEVKLVYAGKEQVTGAAGFKVKFPNQHTLYIRPRGAGLEVSEAQGRKKKIFQWEYEGPEDGRGTFCAPCVEDARAAIGLVQRYFIE
jgi:hypothetical protein